MNEASATKKAQGGVSSPITCGGFTVLAIPSRVRTFGVGGQDGR